MKTEIERLWEKAKSIAKPYIVEWKSWQKQNNERRETDDAIRRFAIEEIMLRSSKRWLVTETPVSEMHISPLSELIRLLCIKSRVQHYEKMRRSEDFVRINLSCMHTDDLMLLRKYKVAICVDDRLRKMKKWYELAEAMIYNQPGDLVLSFSHNPVVYAMPKLLSAAVELIDAREISQPRYLGWIQGNNLTYGIWGNAENAPLLKRQPELLTPPLKDISPSG